MDTRNKIFTIVGAVAITAAAGIGGFVLFATPDKPRTSAVSAPVVSTVKSSPSADTAASQAASGMGHMNGLKDGTYTASTSYFVPHDGQNSVNATVVVSGGTIASVKATGNYTDGESAMYVDSFNSSVESDATGQPLASYSPSRIGGASLTTAAFDSVLDAIRTKARA